MGKETERFEDIVAGADLLGLLGLYKKEFQQLQDKSKEYVNGRGNKDVRELDALIQECDEHDTRRIRVALEIADRMVRR